MAGAPAPMGSLDFVTPNAAIAVAVLSKDPKSIADDIIAMTANREGESELRTKRMQNSRSTFATT